MIGSQVVDAEDLRAWLSRAPEEAIDPEWPIIDAHHHVWDRPPRLPTRGRVRAHERYLADELVEDIVGSGHRVVDTVCVECDSTLGPHEDAERITAETRLARSVAEEVASGRFDHAVRCCGGIVGFVDLTEGASRVEAMLQAHLEVSDAFRGVRHSHGWHESPDIPNSHHSTGDIAGLLGRDDFREGIEVLDRLGLSFDCWGGHAQLAEVAPLARSFPDLTVVLNHIGGPIALGPYEGRRDTLLFDEWRRGIVGLAGFANVVVKLGGFGMPTFGFGYSQRDVPPSSEELAADWKPYIEVLIDAFGSARCMFESNFPVDKISYSYTTLWNAFKRITVALGLSETERDDLLHGTAARTYRIASRDR